MGGQNNLHPRVQLHYQVDEPFLPLYVQAHLRLVHEEHVGLLVFHKHRQQDGQHLLLATRQLVGHQRLTHLREAYLVLRADYLLARLLKQVVHHVLKAPLGLRQALGGIGVALLQRLDDAVADVHLVVQILALQMVQLEVECRPYACVHHVQRLVVEHGRVERTYHVVANMRGILRLCRDVYTLQQVVHQVAVRRYATEHLI